MRNNRKWLAFLLAVVMLLGNLPFAATAAEHESPLGLSVSPADEGAIKANILTAESQIVADGKLVVTYDPAVLTYDGTEIGAAWADPDQVTLSVNAAEGKIILAFASAEAAEAGLLFTVTFTASGYDSIIAVDGESSYISGVSTIPTLTVPACPSSRFTDLGSLSAEAHAAVDFMVANGHMNGMTGSLFGPYTELNRAMMVTILYRLAGSPETSGSCTFTDVSSARYYYNAVIWANENNITKGVSANLFAPDKALTRQELATFLYRFAAQQGYDTTASADLSGYTDADTIGAFAAEAFRWAVAEGIIKGTTDTTLAPQAATTRAQVALMVCRLLSAQD